MLDFTFLFLNMCFEFGSENFMACSHIHCEHSEFFSEFFWNIQNMFFGIGVPGVPKVWEHQILSLVIPSFRTIALTHSSQLALNSDCTHSPAACEHCCCSAALTEMLQVQYGTVNAATWLVTRMLTLLQHPSTLSTTSICSFLLDGTPAKTGLSVKMPGFSRSPAVLHSQYGLSQY